MLDAFASADGVTWLSICVKTLVYATTLVSVGSVLVILSLRSLPETERERFRKVAALMAVAAAALSLVRLPIRASFLMGGTWAGATEPMMLEMVMDSPLGDSIFLRLIGLALICTILLRNRIWYRVAALGVFLVAVSFALRGHALEEPRFLLGGLVTLHILGLSFWIGVFWPLHRLSTQGKLADAGALAEEFGQKATWILSGLVLAGIITLLLLTGGRLSLLTSAYNQFFAIKLAFFACVSGLAAWNKFRLTPDLLGEVSGSGIRMSQSLKIEAILLAIILLVTASLSTVSSPQ
ncbi:MAG: CopD family protein [Marivita sp.]|uniref:copper resistance D family protein n=1 Tax=Marivita sp. TaxID=2003365 RepID=UPI001B129B43|nr:CopD family protein [Marivita sp.]MBO6885641.1 CopD family protein [Marivita sp.]